jgi:hypothetical protein
MDPAPVLRRNNVLWAALAVFMKTTSWSKAQLKAECLLRVAKEKLPPEKEFTIVEFIKTYLRLDPTQ